MRNLIKDDSGSVLIVAVVIMFILAGLSASFLYISTAQSRTAIDGETLSRAFYIAEAGLNAYISDLDSKIYGGDGKDNFGGGTYSVTALSGSEANPWTLRSIGTIDRLERGIEAVVAPKIITPFQQSLFGDDDLTIAGGPFVDSYDSDAGPYADQLDGKPYANNKGGIGCNKNIKAQGNIDIYGNVTPGPPPAVLDKTGTVNISGSEAPATEEMELDPVPYDPPIADMGAYSTSADDTMGPGVFRYTSFSVSSGTLTLDGNVTIYIDGDLTSTSNIELAPGAIVRVYQGPGDPAGTSVFKLAGSGLTNTGNPPSSFQLFSQAATVLIKGSADFYGAVYAPLADIDTTGCPKVFGSIIGRTIDVGGASEFHYDEALADVQLPPSDKYDLVSWREFVP